MDFSDGDNSCQRWQAALIMPEHKAINKKIAEVEGNSKDLQGYCVYIHPVTNYVFKKKIVPFSIFSLVNALLV
ncbi:hypothetical protein SAMN05878482_10469 [Peribacillus simplex]|uniref:Uncharacterized protein n=1 Tax=Peribacillus simplex TaxID=1478 RepID=A0A9X8R9W9_9BACI|nr:hypothetical protein [Peribacillus simplex]SIR50706.1 hypothetical protein SAMN05878482_10469 [Peribacillus simplex]